MPTKSGLPGWFPEDFKTDPELHAAFDDAAEWHAHARKTASGKRAGQAGKPRSHQHARAWDELAAVIELSAETGRLSVTPAPYGKPGGPGLYGVAGNKHSDYYEQIVKALMEKRGMGKGRASAIAWGVLRKWAHGGGKVTPEVSAAATRALAEEDAARAKAHAHSVTWDDVALTARHVIDLAAAPPPQQQQSGSGAVQPRVPAGQAGGGQFGSGSGQPTAAQAHAAHVAHVAHVTGASTQKAALLVAAQDDRAKAAALIKQRDALVKALASAGGKVSAGQAGAKTAKTATTKTSAPATAKTASTTAAAASTTAASTAPAKASTAKAAAAPAASGATGSASAMKAQVAALNTQISGLLAQAAQATAQAAAMK